MSHAGVLGDFLVESQDNLQSTTVHQTTPVTISDAAEKPRHTFYFSSEDEGLVYQRD